MKPLFRDTALVIALTLSVPMPQALAIDLGNALNFGVLSTQKNVVFAKDSAMNALDAGGQSVLMKSGSSITGFVIANPGGITLKSGASAGECITGGGAVKVGFGAACGAIDTSGSSPELGTLSGAIS